MEIAIFVFNAFAENTFILYDKTGECIIIDPGCNNAKEENTLVSFIKSKGLKPTRLINTHFHIDHVLGNKFVADTYQIKPEFHEAGMYFFRVQSQIANSYGIEYKASPSPDNFLEDGDKIEFGNSSLQVIHVPGHSQGSICLHQAKHKMLIAGDVIFKDSIGRTDLPGGDYDTLISGIKEKLLILDDETKVYPGHGSSSTIGYEKDNNPFLR